MNNHPGGALAPPALLNSVRYSICGIDYGQFRQTWPCGYAITGRYPLTNTAVRNN